MSLISDRKIRDVKGISDFLQGAIYCWYKNKWFSFQYLMGKDNFYWNGTPILELYLKH